MYESLLDHLEGDTGYQYKSIFPILVYFYPLYYKILIAIKSVKIFNSVLISSVCSVCYFWDIIILT